MLGRRAVRSKDAYELRLSTAQIGELLEYVGETAAGTRRFECRTHFVEYKTTSCVNNNFFSTDPKRPLEPSRRSRQALPNAIVGKQIQRPFWLRMGSEVRWRTDNDTPLW